MNRIIILITACFLVMTGIARAQFTKENYETVYDSIRELQIDFERSVDVS
nr:hypothetical protein [candidate division Zixibacteria bacterium]NIR62411.1 hypothetical protein [candidate division Zixibacteria bacterium]NIS17612.1 hypothetical protein [candidate division Zixibacteria bacterium]NIS44579.1 hypothetical protein [candidate division Zixibacteria bacterium]NIT53916.1 hypothetical protein [candidate division Zixibacteria bacterium]